MPRPPPRPTLFPYTTLFRSPPEPTEEGGDDEPMIEAALEAITTAQAAIQQLVRSEEHTSELQSRRDLVCRLLLEKKKIVVLQVHGFNSLLKHDVTNNAGVDT